MPTSSAATSRAPNPLTMIATTPAAMSASPPINVTPVSVAPTPTIQRRRWLGA
jgi:hypothetical protein